MNIFAGHQGDRKPNILFAVADDATWKHFGAYGCDWVKTPAFDRVANDGILFTNAYTPNAKSSPSRACLITGRNSWQLEEAGNHFSNFPAKFKTYPEVLVENGYWVGTTGKGWGPGNPGEAEGKPRKLTGKFYNEHKLIPPTKGISNNDYVRNFEEFLSQKPDDSPFCFWFGSLEPHRDYEFNSSITKGNKSLSEIKSVPAFWPVSDSVKIDMLDYAFELEYFDLQLQKMIDILEASGELDNTIIIVTADNGMPFPRAKGQAYEYSNHMPLAVMWGKGLIDPGRVDSTLISFIDIAPTFLDLAGISVSESGMQPIEGQSFKPILERRSELRSHEDNFVLIGKERHDVGRPHDQGYPIRGIVWGDYLYVRNFETDRWPCCNPETGYLNVDGGATKSYILNMRRKSPYDTYYWHLNFGKRPQEELYNIKYDSECMTNLSDVQMYANLKEKLSVKMETELRRQNDPRILGYGEVFDNYKYVGVEINFYQRFMNGEKIPTTWVEPTDYEKEIIELK